MPGIVAACITGHDLCAGGEIIRDTAFSFISPLRPNNHMSRHDPLPSVTP
jgi:hypothetical protein